MAFTRFRRLIGLLILLISLALLCWGLWPFGKLNQTIPLSPSDMQLPPPGSFLPEFDAFSIIRLIARDCFENHSGFSCFGAVEVLVKPSAGWISRPGI
jgi:hypothetical protein